MADFDLSCPMPHAKVKWDEDGNERIGLEHMPCGESLYLIYETSSELLDSRAINHGGHFNLQPMHAVSHTWRVECLSGHVLLLPVDDGTDEVHHLFENWDTMRLAMVIQQLGGNVGE